MKNKKIIFVFAIMFLLLAVYFFKKPRVYLDSLPDQVVSKGDVNSDGEINSKDYILVRRNILGIGSLNGDAYIKADVSSNGIIGIEDTNWIRDYILKKSAGAELPPIPTPPPTYNDPQAVVVDSKYSYIVANFNVLNYGADNTGTRDSTAAFQSAIKDAKACLNSHTCGGTVYVPKGKYLLTRTIDIPSFVSLVGDLEEGTTNGTVLMIKHGAGDTDINKPAIGIHVFGSVQNIAFWYPDQRIDSGNATKYPPTIQFLSGTDGVTLENLYFVNSYTAMDFASFKENNSILFIRNIYGTPLQMGIINDTNYDTIKMENVNFSPKYWLNSGLSNIPNEGQLKKVLMNTSTFPTGILLKKVDWFFFAGINIDGYYTGIRLEKNINGAEGEIFDSKITNCYIPINVKYSRHMAITGSTLTATGGPWARGITISDECDFDYSINNSVISSTGDYAIYHAGSKSLSIVGSQVTGKIGKGNSSTNISLVGNKLTNTNFESCNTGETDSLVKKDYNRRIVTKPKSKNLIKIVAPENTDITDKIKEAINKLKNTGGIVYIPNGTYKISGGITVSPGIEIRGAVPWAHHSGYGFITRLNTEYKWGPIFTLQSNSGINGIDIFQTDNDKDSPIIQQYPYVIKGNGSNVYVMNVSIPSVWNGIDLTGCDNHYVEHIWGEFYNIGINVGGGSKNGIIRDSHFTVNVLYNHSTEAYRQAMTKQTFMKIGPSTNETILNTFIFGPGTGYHFDGATDFYAVGIGSDFSNVGVRLSGKATGTIINSQLVMKPQTTWPSPNGGNHDLAVDFSSCHYYESTSDYSGMVKVFNSMNWGSNFGTAFDLKGTGDFHFNSGLIENSDSPVIRTSNSAQSIVGMIFGIRSDAPNIDKVQLDPGVNGLYMEGNICVDGFRCHEKIANKSGRNGIIGVVDSKNTCK